MEKLKKYIKKHGTNGMHLFSIRELSDLKLKEIKASTQTAISTEIAKGELKAFVSQRGNKTFYHIPSDEVLKWYKERKTKLERLDMKKEHIEKARSLNLKKGLAYLKEKGYKQILIARCLKISRQRVHQLWRK